MLSFASPKESNQRKGDPNAAPLQGSQHFGKESGHENNSAGGDVLYSKDASSRHPQTIFAETPDPFPKCWRGNTGILECDGLCVKGRFEYGVRDEEKRKKS